MKAPVKQPAIALSLMIALLAPARAATESVLYSFEKEKFGDPIARLVLQNGHLFGTTSGHLGDGDGLVFELVSKSGSWKKRTIENLDTALPDGGLIRDASGNLYGTTFRGGYYGGGMVYRMRKDGCCFILDDLWNFGNGSDGADPTGELVMDSAGNIFGTTTEGGATGAGTVFELSQSGGSWKESIVFNFGLYSSDGVSPLGLRMDSSGALYGVTDSGGSFEWYGTVFKLTESGGAWSETILYNFTGGADGAYPVGTVLLGSDGSVYDTAESGGANGDGVVFQLTPSDGTWTQSVLYNFTGGSDGADPLAGLHFGSGGALLGTTQEGGASGAGTVFALTPSGGVWTETVLHSFGGAGDGAFPAAAVITDKSGNIYGTTQDGGAFGYGSVWEIAP